MLYVQLFDSINWCIHKVNKKYVHIYVNKVLVHTLIRKISIFAYFCTWRVYISIYLF